MTKRFVNPEGSEAFPNEPKDEATMHELGFFEEGYPKKMYRDGQEPREVISSDEERGLGKGWVVFDEALCKIGGFYRERFIAAVNNPAEQASILAEYRTLHPALARADSWYKETAPQISELHTQAMLNLVSDRQVEDRERRAIEAKATETLARKTPAKKQAPLRPPRPKVVPIGDLNVLKKMKSLSQVQAAAELGLNSTRQVRNLEHDGKLTKTAKGRVAVDDKFEEQSRLRHSARPE